MASPSEKLNCLYSYLKHLPPLAKGQVYKPYGLANFAPDENDITEMGQEGAINRQLEVTFGTRAFGPVALTERGKELVRIVDILEKAMDGCGESVILEKWVEDLIEAAKEVYEKASVELPKVRERPAVPEADDSSEIEVLDGPPKPAADKTTKQAVVDVHRELKTLKSFDDPQYEDIAEDRNPAKRAGAQTFPLLYDVSRKYHTAEGKVRIRCAASVVCKTTWASPRDKTRILVHAMECGSLKDEWCINAGKEIAAMGKAPSAASASKRRATSPPVEVEVPRQPSSSSSRAVLKRQKTDNIPVHPILQTMVDKGKKSRDANTTRLLVIFLCCNLVPPEVVDTGEFTNFTLSFGTSYKAPSASTFRRRLIPIEAARVAIAAEDFLRTCRNLTISFDGGKTRKKIGFYSVHIITAEGRSYLIALDDASRVRHTAEYIAELLEKTMRRIGFFRFIGVVSDNTGNCQRLNVVPRSRGAK